MDLLFFVLPPALLLVTVLVAAGLSMQRTPDEAKAMWREAARRLGLTLSPEARRLLTGRIDGFDLTITKLQGDDVMFIQLELEGGGQWPPGLSVALGSARLATGDPRFDAVVRLDAADPGELRALLDAPARKRIHDVLASSFGVSGGKLQRAVESFHSPEEIEVWVREAVSVAKLLRRPGPEAARRLMVIAAQDPERAVRNQALATVIERHPGTSEWSAAVEAAAQSDDPLLQVLGAQGQRDVPRLLLLLDAGGVVACRAAHALGGLGDASAEPALLSKLGADDVELRITAARALASVGSPRAVLPLMELTKGLLADASLKSAAREAIAQIQARAGGEPGALSVVNPSEEGGELSMAADEGGLSLVAEPSEASPPRRRPVPTSTKA